MIMMVERIFSNSLVFVLPTSEIGLRYRYYSLTSSGCSWAVYGSAIQHIYNALSGYKQWTIPDFTIQCEIMNSIGKILY